MADPRDGEAEIEEKRMTDAKIDLGNKVLDVRVAAWLLGQKNAVSHSVGCVETRKIANADLHECI